MIIPLSVDVPYDRRPFANWLILLLILGVFCLQIAETWRQSQQAQQQLRNMQHQNPEDFKRITEEMHKPPFYSWFLNGWNIKGIVGHMWLHGGILHLIGNMLFLWIFGNAVCAKVGNLRFGLFYLIFGIAAAVTHLIFSGELAIGASGAINGVVGMFLVFFPQNDINCVWIFWFPLLLRPYVKAFTVSSYWIILLWFAYDIWGLIHGGGNIAYCAHIGGFGAGFVLALFLLDFKLVKMEKYERSLLQLIGLHKTESEESYRADLGQWQHLAGTGGMFRESKPADAAPKTIPFESGEPDVQNQKILSEDEKTTEEFIRFSCICGKKFKVPLTYAGKMGLCPVCKKQLNIPAKSDFNSGAVSSGLTEKKDDFIRFSCECGKRIKVPKKYAGRTGRCPNCKTKVKIPER